LKLSFSPPNTISRTTRFADGSLQEYQLPETMPGLKGASAEFIPNKTLPHYSNEVVQLSNITADEFVIGHLFGGIQSSSPSAFTDNQTNLTSADPTVYEVKLVKITSLSTPQIEGKNPFSFSVSPNPTTNDTVRIQFDMPYLAKVNYILTTIEGKIVEEGEIEDVKQGVNAMSFDLNSIQSEFVIITFIFDDKFYRSQKVIKK
jgi:hypothetical protein